MRQESEAQHKDLAVPVSFRRDRSTKLPPVYKSDDVQAQLREATEESGYVLLENIGVGIYGLDLNGFVTFVNPAARRMTGWSLEDLRGRTQHSMVHHSHADGSNYPREECPIYMAFHDGRTHCREDEVFWRKDGSSFPVEYTSTPVFTDGQLTGAVVVFSDISDRVRKRAWDRARIDILQRILKGRDLDEILSALCNAFAAFQRGYTLSVQRKVEQGDELPTNIEDVTRGKPFKQLNIVNAAGQILALLSICQIRSEEAASLHEAIIESNSLLELALNR